MELGSRMRKETMSSEIHSTEYQEYLDSDNWERLREEKFKIAGKQCYFCHDDREIEVHHIRYRHLHDCTPADLIVLCRYHHKALHAACKKFKIYYGLVEEPNARGILDKFFALPPPVRVIQKPPERKKKDALNLLRGQVKQAIHRWNQGGKRIKETRELVERLTEVLNKMEEHDRVRMEKLAANVGDPSSTSVEAYSVRNLWVAGVIGH